MKLAWRERRGRARLRLKRASWVDVGTWVGAFATAVGLWLLVNIGERTSERTLRVRIEPENIPSGMVITNPIPEYAEVRVSGSGLILSSIDGERLSTALDLSGARPGVFTYALDPKSFQLPRKVEVSRVTPSQVTFHLDRMADRTLPVRLERTGELPSGLRLKELALIPEKVDVVGPKGRLDSLQAIFTAPFDLGELQAGTSELAVDLVQPGGLVRLASPSIRVRAVVEHVIVERTLRKVPVAVRDAPSSWEVRPQNVTVVVRGPELDLKDLALEPGAAYVEAGELDGDRAHRVAPQVALPSGIELVRVEPREVTLEPVRAGSARRSGSLDKPREKQT